MIYERIGGKLDKIVEETKRFRIRWRPIEEYLKYYCDNKDLNEYITAMLANKETKLNLNKSFIAINGYSYFAVLSYISDDSSIELIGVIHKNASIIKIPQYFMEYSIEDLIDSINEYIEYKKGDYNWETTDLFEFLDSFVSDN